MRRAQIQCASCPFRGANDAFKREVADILPEDWPCHTEQMVYREDDIQCRGHWEARRKFAAKPTPEQGDACGWCGEAPREGCNRAGVMLTDAAGWCPNTNGGRQA